MLFDTYWYQYPLEVPNTQDTLSANQNVILTRAVGESEEDFSQRVQFVSAGMAAVFLGDLFSPDQWRSLEYFIHQLFGE